MPTRRDVLGAGGLALASVALGGCDSSVDDYESVAAGIWRHASAVPDTLSGLLAELVRYATLAPSTYNSQCWQFRLARDAITILPDPARQSPAVDPDGHLLHVSLGCAVENLVQSGASIGLGSYVQVGAGIEDGITVRFELAPPSPSPISRAIPDRQTTRSLYDGKPVPAAELTRLERYARGPGVTPVLVTDGVQKSRILELVTAASREWHADPAKVTELRRWTRFDTATALVTRDGLAPGPLDRTSLPPAIGSALFSLLESGERATDRLVRELRSAAGLVAFGAAINDRPHWVEVGRSMQRFALQSTSLGIRHAWVNAVTEIPGFLPQLGMELGEPSGRPSVVLRFGYGPLRPRSLRLPAPSLSLPPAPAESPFKVPI